MNISQKLFRKKRPKESRGKYVAYLLHLWCGLLASVVIFIVCLSGSIYVFRSQIIDFVNRDKVYVQPLGNKLSCDSIVSICKKKNYNILSIRLSEVKSESYKLDVHDDEHSEIKTIYVDPYTGDELRVEDASLSVFFSLMLEIHTSLLIPEIGKDIVGASILIFVFMLVSGLVLWVPKTIKQVKTNLKVKWKARFKRLNYDLHKVIGFYFLIPLLFISVTGLYISYSWVKSGLIQAMGGPPVLSVSNSEETSAQVSSMFNEILKEIKSESLSPEKVSLGVILNNVSKTLPYHSLVVISLPTEDEPTYRITKLNRMNWLRAKCPDVLIYNLSGLLVKQELFYEKPLHKQFVTLSLPLHTGEIMGLPSLIIYFVCSLIGCSLPVTGFLVWLNKGDGISK